MLYHPHHESELGQGLVEYALILIFVSIFAMIILLIFGPQLGNIYSNIYDALGLWD